MSQHAHEAAQLTEGQVRLFRRFSDLGISAHVASYPAHTTVEEGKRLRGSMAGTFTKNLLLKDKKGRLFLLAIHEDRNLDLKTLHTLVGGSGRLGFAAAERMEALLGVSPGALTPLGILNDEGAEVTVVIERALMSAEQLNFHPLVQQQSVGLSPADLMAFVKSCRRDPIIVDLPDGGEGA